MPFDSRLNYSQGRTCADCGALITNRSTRCQSCAMKYRQRQKHKPFYKLCRHCRQRFRIKPSQASEIHFCSTECRTAHGRQSRKAVCAVCGKQFERAPAHIARVEKPTCSRVCRGKLKRNQVELTCHWCGKHFSRPPSQAPGDHAFCSRKCHQAFWRGERHSGYDSINCTCEVCGKGFVRSRSRVEKNGGKFCSARCFALSQVIPGTSEYRGPNWREQCRKARKRDRYTCQACGVHQKQYGKSLDVHHIVPFRMFGLDRYAEANHLDNLISLCRTCHMLLERGHRTLDELRRQLQCQAQG